MRKLFWIAMVLQCFVMGLAADCCYAATISANVTLRQFDGVDSAVPVIIELWQFDSMKRSEIVHLDISNRFLLSNVTPGIYDVRIKAPHWLSALRANRTVTGDIDMGILSLTNGDCDGDDEVTSTDLSILGMALGSTPDDSNWDSTADLDGDQEITSTDLSILGLSLGKTGESVDTKEYVYMPGVPSGSVTPALNASETYTSSSTSSQGHLLEYSFDWGDGTSSPWSTSTSASHLWSVVGTNTVTVSARCQAHPNLSATSPAMTVNVTDFDLIEMVYIPTGSFLMGNSGSEPYSSNINELPQHSVYLSDYYIGKYEVTRGQYRLFVNTGGYTNSAFWSTDGWNWKLSSTRIKPHWWDANQDWGSGTFGQTDNEPVVGVSYYEAEAFCNWAGGHLPTEAQWERAARWNPSTNHPNVYPWGDAWDEQKCNNMNDSLYPGYQTAPVGSYSSYPSPSGCQDMAGNVYEWVKDWYGSSYYSQSPQNNPQGPASGSYHPMRGGGYSGTGEYSNRCGNRGEYPDGGTNLGESYNCVGFRLTR